MRKSNLVAILGLAMLLLAGIAGAEQVTLIDTTGSNVDGTFESTEDGTVKSLFLLASYWLLAGVIFILIDPI